MSTPTPKQITLLSFRARMSGLGALLLIGTAGLIGSASYAADTQAPIVWKLDNLKMIGGQVPSVLGAPQIVNEAPVGAAMHFDGKADGIVMPVIPITGWDRFTVEILFKPESNAPFEQRFVHFEDAKGNRGTLESRVTPEGLWYLDTFLATGNGTSTVVPGPGGTVAPATGAGGGGGRANGGAAAKAASPAATTPAPVGTSRAGAPASRGGGGGRGNGASLALIDATKTHPTNRWFWVALRYDGKQMSAWVDGVKELEGSVNFPKMLDGRISLGVRQNIVFWFKGAIAEARFSPEAVPEEKLQRVK